MELSVLTFNIWDIPFWFCLNRERRIARIAEFVKKYDPDIICFQESFDVKNRLMIHKSLGKYIYKVPKEYLDTRRLLFYKKFDKTGGLLTLSKFKIIKSKFRAFKSHPFMALPERGAKKGFLEIFVKTPMGPLLIVNVHFLNGKGGTPGKIRNGQLKMLFNRLKDEKNTTIFAGDFNEVAHDHEENFHGLFSKIGFVDSARFLKKVQRPTLRMDNPYTTILFNIRASGISERYDHVLIKNGNSLKLEVVDTRTLSQPRNPLSDHEPVLAKLRISKIQ